MTTERGSFQDPGGVDAILATRDDAMTGTGLDDSAPTAGSGFDTAASSARDSSGFGTGPGSSTTSGDRLQDAAGGVVERVAGTAQEKVGTQVDSGLAKAGDLLEQLAGAVRQSGEQLRGDQPQIAGFADTAAGQVDRVSAFLRQTDLQGLVREAEDFARRQPAVFLGGALAAGLIASRFLKASPQGGGSRTFGAERSSGRAGSRYGSTQLRASRTTGLHAATGYAGTDAPIGTGAEHGGV